MEKPVYANALGISGCKGANGELKEAQLDFSLNYATTQVKLTDAGPATATVRQVEPVASVILSRDGIVSLVASIRKTMGAENFDALIEFLQEQV